MNDYDSQARAWISETMGKFSFLSTSSWIVIEWNNTFTRRMGDAIYFPLEKKGRIRLSLPLWPRASEQERRETVIHELCHVLNEWFRFNKSGYRYNPGHGTSWKRLMLTVGLAPKRCHSVDRTGLKRKVTRVAATCGCMTYNITQTRATKIQNGTAVYCCRKCRGLLRVGT